ncbi:TetR/AcrR family transcriptional regulator [Kribbella speibonae]|uniref:TetR/AcrR family transcriptional regulator n=1 Tax=Kribbella speibonae TaxID=1572660 RepID=A0ABY2AAY9_9ACTN|nr:TetR/AcrR family transcriptional regulator [Kribbella speibonae]
MLNVRSVDDEDLTGRAVIRNAALRLFAERGPDAVSVRQIAEAAGVSPALVLHHYGSKAGLREEVDRYAAAQLDALMEDVDEIGEVLTTGSNASIAEMFSQALPADSPLPTYLRRLLLTGDPAGQALFRRWYEVSRLLLGQLVDAGFASPTADPEVRTAFMLSADLILLLLREPLTDVLGFDPMSGDGLARWAAEVTRIYREGVLVVPAAETGEQDED